LGGTEFGSVGSAATEPNGVGAGVVAGHGPKAHISVTIDFNDLQKSLTHATGTMMFGDTLSAGTVRRLACDAEILPIVLGSKSQPLDVGTSQRLVTQPMRRALNARDKGCVACGAPPNRCEAHHLKHWIDGGITAVSNLVLLCKRDHLDLHSGHWDIQIIDDVVHVTRPTWADPGRIPPNRYQPPHLPDQPPHLPDRPPHLPNRPPHLPGQPPHLPDQPPATYDRSAQPATAPNKPAGPTGPAIDPWGDDLDTGSPSHPAPAPVIPWADDPPPPTVAAPDIPWASDPPPPTVAAPDISWGDEPSPVARSAAPWSEAGCDPWGVVQGDSRCDSPDTGPGSDHLPPTSGNALGSVA
jgi:hypothetical protein